MSAFPKTRAAAGYAARHARSELARARAAILLARLDACEDLLPGGDGDVPAVLPTISYFGSAANFVIVVTQGAR